MKLNKHVICGITWLAYITVTLSCFSYFNIQCLILSVFAFALTSWFYGTSGGFLAILLHMPYHAYITGHLFFDIVEYYNESKLTGYGMAISTVVLTGLLKNRYETINRLMVSLEEQVEDRTTELNNLTKQLIDHDEEIRKELGQDIHDGLGQYLTGLLLYSSSLESELRGENSPEADRASILVESAQKSLSMARKTSRTLFPIQMPETGMKASILELTSYFNETNNIQFDIRIDRREQYLTNEEKLHLYRIVYEGILNALHHTNPTHFLIALTFEHRNCQLILESNGRDAGMTSQDNMEMQLMNYRAQQINGLLTVAQAEDEKIRIKCTLPYNQPGSDECI